MVTFLVIAIILPNIIEQNAIPKDSYTEMAVHTNR